MVGDDGDNYNQQNIFIWPLAINLQGLRNLTKYFLGKSKIMTLDLGKISNQKAHGYLQTSIGKLYIFSINANNQRALKKQLGCPIKNCDPEIFARNLAVFICYPEDQLIEGKFKPDTPVISSNDVANLTGAELEKIARIYVNGNDYLYKKLEFKTRTNDKGGKVHHAEYKGVEYPRKESESYINYLHRLSINEEEKQKKQMEKLLGSISGLNSFSSKLSNSIKNTLFLGDSLSRAMESFRAINKPTIHPTTQNFPITDFIENERLNEKRRLKPFNELSDRLDQLIDLSIQSSEFMIEANSIQTSIAAEIKSSGDITKKYSKKNNLLTFVVIFISLLGLFLTAYTITANNAFNKMQQSKFQNSVESIVTCLSNIDQNFVAENKKIQNLLSQITIQLNGDNKQISMFDQLLEQNKTILNKLRKKNSVQYEQLERLKKRISELENSKK